MPDNNIPRVEPISDEVRREEFGAFRQRVQALLDKCGHTETTAAITDRLRGLTTSDELERALDVLEDLAARIEFGKLEQSDRARDLNDARVLAQLRDFSHPLLLPMDEEPDLGTPYDWRQWLP